VSFNNTLLRENLSDINSYKCASCIARFVLTLQVLDFFLFSTGMNVNLFIFVWNILIGFELSTASRGLQRGKVKMETIKVCCDMIIF